MIIAKTIALSVAGTATVLGSTSPLMHIGATKNNWINKWYPQTEELQEPILKDCKVSDENTHYTVFLETSNEGGGNSGPKISFRVEKTNGSWKKGSGEVVWKDGKKVGTQGLDKWHIGYKSDREVDFMYPFMSGSWEQNRKANCSAVHNKIQPLPESQRTGFGSGVPLLASQVTFSLSKEKCQKNFSSIVCGINIDSENKLKWIDGKEPKITYTAFR
ncbi:hypothetical protein WEN_01925 [Mycoplasma wenyonii str. Massachusetts]|uniref:Uncharacterized protein n=1 Tax=Mycoplasma wenyonii (strain Massachusetts) TaxID=1197325 RepID=I6Z6G1_MYCWM|nr:hypothetical protein [Mycoplasma wenyonii]AFN65178.1 hypothetical protein WEN_01925 [Mycoplasma wenyonii str. Massachusetts]